MTTETSSGESGDGDLGTAPPWSIEAAFDLILADQPASHEFSRYSTYHAEVASALENAKQEILSEPTAWLDDRQGVRPRGTESRAAKRGKVIAAVTAPVAFLLCFVPGTAATMVEKGSLEFGVLNGIALGLLVVAVMSLVVVFLIYSERREAENAVQKFDSDNQKTVEDAVRSVVAQRYAITLRDHLGARGILQFPVHAPRLIESDSGSVMISQAIRRAHAFVWSHETCALGITGPRGAGKSTLLNQVVRSSRENEAVAICLPAPVEYTAEDLLRSIVFALREQTQKDGADRSCTRRRTWSAVAGSGAVVLGLCILLGSIFPAVGGSVRDALLFFLLQTWPSFLAVVLAAGGVTLLVRAIRWKPRTQSKAAPTAGIRALAHDLEFESSSGGGLSAKGWGVAEVEVTRSSSRRALTHSTIVGRLRTSMRDLTLGGSRKIVIAIDELDKLPDHESVIRTINVLKDLFHVNGVHVLVTVSDEARAHFGLGRHERDVFDSSFDDILDVERLRVSDSRQIIDARVVGVPTQLLVLSHVASAGIARDLIRNTRNLVDAAVEFESIPPWRELARLVVSGEGQTLLTDYARLSKDKSNIPRASEALDELDALSRIELQVTRMPTDLGSPLSGVFARKAILLVVIEWLIAADLSDLAAVAPTIEKFRDAIVLASQDGGSDAALELALDISSS